MFGYSITAYVLKPSQHASPQTLTPADANLFEFGSQYEKNMQSPRTDLDSNLYNGN